MTRTATPYMPPVDLFDGKPPQKEPVDLFGGEPPDSGPGFFSRMGERLNDMGPSRPIEIFPAQGGQSPVAVATAAPTETAPEQGATPQTGTVPVLLPAPERSPFQRMGDALRGSFRSSPDRNAIALALSEKHQISPTDALKHFDELTKNLRDQPTSKEYMTGLLTAPVVAGLVTNPLTTLGALAGFTGIAEAENFVVSKVQDKKYTPLAGENLTSFLPADTAPNAELAVEIIDFLGKGAVTSLGMKGVTGSAWFRKLTKRERGLLVLDVAAREKQGVSKGQAIREAIRARGGKETAEGKALFKEMQDKYVRGEKGAEPQASNPAQPAEPGPVSPATPPPAPAEGPVVPAPVQARPAVAPVPDVAPGGPLVDLLAGEPPAKVIPFPEPSQVSQSVAPAVDAPKDLLGGKPPQLSPKTSQPDPPSGGPDPAILKNAYEIMREEMQNSQTKGTTVDIDGTRRFHGASSPQWMKEINAEAKASKENLYTRRELGVLLSKAANGKSMTEKQAIRFERVQEAAEGLAGSHPDLVAAQDASLMEKKGYEVVGRQKVPAVELEEGDKFVGTVDGIHDEYTVKGDAPNGDVIIKDGVTHRVDPFDTVTVEGLKRNEKPPRRPVSTASGFGDTGGYASRAQGAKQNASNGAPGGGPAPGDTAEAVVMQMPEIVELAQQLMDGKLPHVARKFRSAGTMGMFTPKGSGKIRILADLFKDTEQASKVMAHEIGHLVDYLPDRMIKGRGNILGRIASLKGYLKHTISEKPGGAPPLTPADRTRLKKEARALLKAEAFEKGLDQEITRTLPVEPKDLLSIFNAVEPTENVSDELLLFIKGLSTAEKKSIVKAAMKGRVPEEVQAFAKVVKEKVAKQPKVGIPGHYLNVKGKRVSEAEIRAKYRELVEEEIKKRRLIKLELVMAELKGFTQKWKPFDLAANPKYTKYRHSGPELYADALSAMITDPAYLKAEAPVFYQSWWNYLENKPTVKQLYEEIRTEISHGSESLSKHRTERIKGMFERGHESRAAARERGKSRVETVKETILTGLIDSGYPVLKHLGPYEKRGGTLGRWARSVRYQLESLHYLASEADVYLREVRADVLKPLDDAKIPVDEFGVYLFRKRVMADRSEIANPLGHTPENVEADLANMEKAMGAEKFKVMEEAAKALRRHRKDKILPLVTKSGLFTKELLETMWKAEDYAKFSVTHWLDEKFGGGVGAAIYQQVGTLSEIENPLIPTVLQDFSMIRAARINEAKKEMVKVLHLSQAIEPAKMVWSAEVKGKVAKPPPDPHQALLTVMLKGKPRHFYVSRKVAEMFAYAPVEAKAVAKVMAAISQPIREILVTKNPIWMVRNVVRDFFTTRKNIPEVRIRDIFKLAGYYKRAFGEVYREVYKGERSDVIRKMMAERMLVKHRIWTGKEETFDTELDRLAAEFELVSAAHRAAPGARRKLKQFWEALDRTGRMSDIWGKVAGYRYLQDQGTRDIREIGHIIRTRVGTPDIYRRGAWQIVTNNLFMFSNVGKEGIRASIESFFDDKSAYITKTVWMNIMPKLLIGALGSGAILYMLEHGDDTKDDSSLITQTRKFKRIIDGIPEYDLAYYTIVPLGLTNEGKSVYLRIPNDYEGQFWGAVGHKILGAKFTGHDGVINTIAEHQPYSPNPVITALAHNYTYYVKGQNPVDNYRGRGIIPKRAFEAGGAPARRAMAKATWKELGGSVIYTPAYDDLTRDRTNWEKALSVQPFSMLGAFLKITDQGISEKINRALSDRRSEKAKEGLTRTNGLIRLLNGDTVTEEQMVAIARQKTHPLHKEVLRLVGRQAGTAWVSALTRAQGREETAIVLQVLLDHNFIPQGGSSLKGGKDGG